jgi:hypothetical protein
LKNNLGINTDSLTGAYNYNRLFSPQNQAAKNAFEEPPLSHIMSQRNRSNRGLGSVQDAKEVKEQNDRLKALSFNGSRSHRLQNLSQDRGSRVSGQPADLGSQGSF